MAWKIEFESAARKELEQLDRPVARRIMKFLYGRVGKLLENSMILAKSAKGFKAR
jgi:mRNA interferase RelE/StbE